MNRNVVHKNKVESTNSTTKYLNENKVTAVDHT